MKQNSKSRRSCIPPKPKPATSSAPAGPSAFSAAFDFTAEKTLAFRAIKPLPRSRRPIMSVDDLAPLPPLEGNATEDNNHAPPSFDDSINQEISGRSSSPEQDSEKELQADSEEESDAEPEDEQDKTEQELRAKFAKMNYEELLDQVVESNIDFDLAYNVSLLLNSFLCFEAITSKSEASSRFVFDLSIPH